MSESAYSPYGHQPGYGSDPRYTPASPQVTTHSAGAGPANYASAGPLPPANAGWAVAALLFFWPLAFSAFTHAFKVYPLWASGDHQGAQYASDRTKQLGKWALWIAIGLFVVFLLFYVVLIATLVSSVPRTY